MTGTSPEEQIAFVYLVPLKAAEAAAVKIAEAINKPGGNVIPFPKTSEAGA